MLTLRRKSPLPTGLRPAVSMRLSHEQGFHSPCQGPYCGMPTTLRWKPGGAGAEFILIDACCRECAERAYVEFDAEQVEQKEYQW